MAKAMVIIYIAVSVMIIALVVISYYFNKED